MSQVCNLIELLLVDVRDLGSDVVREALALVASRALLHGAVGTDDGVSNTRSEMAAHVDTLDFWFIGEAGAWPFERAASFAGVEQARTLFVSTSEAARVLAAAVGMMTSAPDIDAIDRMLP